MPVEAYYRPTSKDKALDLASEHGSSLEVIAGGTVMLPQYNDGYKFPERVMGLKEAGLDYIDNSNGKLILGSTLTLNELIEQSDEPILQEAAKHCAGNTVRNQGTVGGNLFAQPPLGDLTVALLALDADVKLERQGGERWIPVSEFHTGPGQTALEDDELVTEVAVPQVEGETAYDKLTRNQEPAPGIVTVAANIVQDGGTISKARVAANGAGSHPVRLEAAESVLDGASLDDSTIDEASEAAMDEADPPKDPVASSWYRSKMIRQYVSDALQSIKEGSN